MGSVLSGTGMQPRAQSPAPAVPSAEDDLIPLATGLETIARGPMHEAFAEPLVDFRSQQPLQVTGSLPAAVNERPGLIQPPADQRSAEWLPGYWGLEEPIESSGRGFDSASDLQWCWVSGTYRYAPPGRRWVAGSWQLQNGISRWTPGYWIDETAPIAFLPPPPALVNETPSAAPSTNHFWVPGQWIPRGGQYRWRPGYYVAAQRDWVWVPAHYVPDPRGYVYISGYWDYRLEDRGLLYCPVRVRPTYQISQIYQPAVPINVGVALVNLFVQPGYQHYYYGNYYGDQYSNVGLVPWAGYSSGGRYANYGGGGRYGYGPGYYDPLAVYYGVNQPAYFNQLSGIRRGVRRNPALQPGIAVGNRRSDLIRNGLIIAGAVTLIDAVSDGRRRDSDIRRLQQQQQSLQDYVSRLQQQSQESLGKPLAQVLGSDVDLTVDAMTQVDVSNRQSGQPTASITAEGDDEVRGSATVGTTLPPDRTSLPQSPQSPMTPPDNPIGSNVLAGDAPGPPSPASPSPTAEPVDLTPTPSPTSPAPVPETPMPTPESPMPSPAAPSPPPVAPNPQPVAPSPQPVAPSPQPVAPSPSPVAPSPSPVAPSPQPVAPSPQPVAPSPSPVAPSPQPVAPSPQPVAPSPQPVAPSPQPVAPSSPSPAVPSPPPTAPAPSPAPAEPSPVAPGPLPEAPELPGI